MFGAGGRGLRKPARSRLTPALDVGGRPADRGTLAEGSEQAGRRKDGSQLGLQGALGDQRHPGERAGVSRPRSLSRWARLRGGPPLLPVHGAAPHPETPSLRPPTSRCRVPDGVPEGKAGRGPRDGERCAFALCSLRCGAGGLALRPLGVSGRKSDGRARGSRGTGAHTRTLFTLRFLAARGGAPGGEPVSLCGAV